MSAFDPRVLLRPELADLEEYVPILPYEALSRKLGIPIDAIVKLDANENPWGPLPAVQEALAEYAFYHIYPDPQQTELREALSAFVGAPAANILPSHGADEMLDLICRVLLAPGDAIINTPPTFGMYEFDAALAGAKVVDVTRRAAFAVDVDAIDALVAERMESGEPLPKILFLTSPNNPTGNWLDDASFDRLVNLPLLIVLDEAYVEFADHPSRAPLVPQRDNLVVLRTFSKAAGIAGLRLGYAIAPEWLMAALWSFKQPYNVNVAAAVAGIASLRHADQIAAVVDKIKRERARLFDLLQQIPWLRPHPSQANFILCDVLDRDARSVKLALESRGVLIRHYAKPGLENCLRISVGTPQQTDRLIYEMKML